MNIKNKILLTFIVVIFTICLFNTNCFATNSYYSELLGGDVVVPEWLNDYNYLFVTNSTGTEAILFFSEYNFTAKYSGGKLICYPQSSTKPIYMRSYMYSSSFPGLTILKYINSVKSTDTFSECISNISISIYEPDKSLLLCDFDVYSKEDSSVVLFEQNYNIERGTSDDNTITDNGETGNETIGGDSENTTDSDDSGGILSSIKEGFENVVNFFKELISGTTNIFKTIGDNFLDLFAKLGEWFSDLFEKLGNWFSSLGSSIGGFFNSLWDNIKSFFTGVVDFFANFWELIENFFIRIFRFLFVPEQNSFTGIIDIVKSKFDFIETIKISANSLKDLISNVGTAPKLTININDNEFGIKKLTIIDLEWYKPYKTYGDLILTGFIYAFFLWRLFITIPNILNGTGGAVQDTYKVSKAIDIDMSDFNKNFKL